MYEGTEDEQRNPPAWDPNGGVPPPLPLEWDPRGVLPPPLPQELTPMNPPSLQEAEVEAGIFAQPFESQLEARRLEVPEELNAREVSKQLFQEERDALAQEIRAERQKNREKLATLGVRLQFLSGQLAESTPDWEQSLAEWEELAGMRSEEANSLAGRFRGYIAAKTGFEFPVDILAGRKEELALDKKEGADEERQVIEEEVAALSGLIALDNTREALKKKIADHYAGADEAGKQQYEELQKSVEHSLIRNNAFIVHTFTTHETLRHNENSNVSKRATLDDDLDLLLALEPSVSTSSVTPGVKTMLFQEDFGNIGVIIGGGQIEGATQSDAGSVSAGIKNRRIIGQQDVSHSDIDTAIEGSKKSGGYNEIVVNDAKVFGIFKSVNVDESGVMTGNPSAFEKYIDIAKSKGIPPYVMTPDREVFEFVSINAQGVITIGKAISPEDVAKGNAGLSGEKRKEVGERILEKHLFRDVTAQIEATQILRGANGETGEVNLSQDEYLEQLRKNSGEVGSQLTHFPESLRNDASFMLESAKIDAVGTYQNAGKELQADINFIRQIYELRKDQPQRGLYSALPQPFRQNQEVALLAVENDDYESLDESFSGKGNVRDRVVEKMIEKQDPDSWFSREVGQEQVIKPYVSMGSVNLTEQIVNDPSFVSRLNERYPNYHFSVDEYDKQSLLVKKLS